MALCNISSALIISRRLFAFIKGYRTSDIIDHLLYNQCEVHLSDKDTDKKIDRNLSGQLFIGVLYTVETPAIIILLRLFGKLFLWNGVNGG